MEYEPLAVNETSSDEVIQSPHSIKIKSRAQMFCFSILPLFLLTACLFLLGWHIGTAHSCYIGKAPMARTKYGTNENYMTLDHQYDYLWNVTVKLVDVPNGNGEIQRESGAISMFHQLHCLTSFRRALQGAREGKPVAFDFKEDHHWPHCLYYMRQTVLCFADEQIERFRTSGDKRFIDGSEDWRQCRDSQKLYDLYS